MTTESDRIAKLRQIILESESGIANEFDKKENSWAACFATRVTSVSGQLDIIKRLKMLPDDRIAALCDKADQLIAMGTTLREQYPSRRDIPPEAVQSAALAELKAILVDI